MGTLCFFVYVLLLLLLYRNINCYATLCYAIDDDAAAVNDTIDDDDDNLFLKKDPNIIINIYMCVRA